MANIRWKCGSQGSGNILIKTQFILKFGNCINRQHLVKAYFSYKQWSYIWTGRMKNDVTEAVTTWHHYEYIVWHNVYFVRPTLTILLFQLLFDTGRHPAVFLITTRYSPLNLYWVSCKNFAVYLTSFQT